jgi:PST family polysaccharide transporter
VNLVERFVNGVAWRAAGQLGRQLAVIVIGIVLARLLGPKEYGLVTMATVVVGFVSLFDDFGVATALIRVQETNDVQRSSVLWFGLALGSTLGLLTAFSGIPIAHFYREPALVKMTAVLALRFPLSALSIVPSAELQRNLEFRTLARIDFVSVVFGGIGGLMLAVFGAGAWALVAQDLLGTALGVVQFWLAVRWRPTFVFRRESLRGLLGFGLYVMAVEVNGYITRNLDNVLIGRFYGKSDLALYNRAYSFIYLPLYLARTVSTVLFPTLSSLSHDVVRVKRAFLRVAGVVAFVTWPAVVGLVVTAEPFVRTAFGPQWVGMIPLLQILAPVALWQSIGTLHGLLFQARGRADLQFRINLLSNVFGGVGICTGLHWGPRGVALGYLVGSAATATMNLTYALREVDGSLKDLLKVVWKTAVCCLAMATVVTAFLAMLPPQWPATARLGCAAIVGAAAYALVVVLLRPEAWNDVRGAMKTMTRGPVATDA